MKLLIAMLVAIAVSLGVFFGCREIGNFLVWKYYLADDVKEARLDAYIADLDRFARENRISVNDTDKFAEWSGGKYVYAVIYKDSNLIYAPDWFDGLGGDMNDEVTDTAEVSQELGSDIEETQVEQTTVDATNTMTDAVTDDSFESNSESFDESEAHTESGSELDSDAVTEVTEAIVTTEKPASDRDFDKYLNEEAKEKYQAALDNILAGNAELTPINCTDGILLATIVDYSEDFVYNIVVTISLICSIAVVGIIMFFSLSRLTSRVKKLAEKVRLVEKGNLSEPLIVSGNDEIASLAEDVNSMRNSVVHNMTKGQQAWEANAGLITAMSHDIRTPLTVLLGYLDLMELQEENGANLEYIEICKNNALRIKGLSDDMFSYFLVFGQKDLVSENMEVQSLETIKNIISERVFLMEENGYRFRWDNLPPDLSVKIDTMYMNRVIDNVFSNLSKYADPECDIVIRFAWGELSVGVEFENVIRNDDTHTESNHIGIKTCEKIMEKLGGQFTAENADGRFSAAFSLPVYVEKK